MFRTIIVLVIATVFACQPTSNDPFGNYTSTEPIILGKGSLSLDTMQWNNCFVAATNTFYFTRSTGSGAILMSCTRQGDEFVDFQKVFDEDGSIYTDVFVSPNGVDMYFSSTLPSDDLDTIFDFHIWHSVHTSEGWSKANEIVGSELSGSHFYPTVAESGNLYFVNTPEGSRNSDLYFLEKSLEGYKSAKRLPVGVNTTMQEGDIFIAPDESFLIFAGFDRENNLGKSDLYISLDDNGVWEEPQWMGAIINSEGYDGSPFVTKDLKHLIFTSSRGSTDEYTFFNHYVVDFELCDWIK